MGLESVVESWVSVIEHHNNSKRPLTQERLEHEAMVALNGPPEVHCVRWWRRPSPTIGRSRSYQGTRWPTGSEGTREQSTSKFQRL